MLYKKGMKVRSLINHSNGRKKGMVFTITEDAIDKVFYIPPKHWTSCWGEPSTFQLIDDSINSETKFLDSIQYNEINYYEDHLDVEDELDEEEYF